MSLSNRRTLLLGLAALPLGACNFTPVYGTGGSGQVIRNQISVQAPDTRLEFEMVARLEERIGVGSAYTLSYSLEIGQRNIAIDESENIDRINVVGALAFTVRDRAGQVVQQGEVSTFTAYATTSSPVATASARRDAEDRLAVALADQTISRLIADASNWT